MELADFQFQDEKLQVGRFELAGSASVKDPSARRRPLPGVDAAGQYRRRHVAGGPARPRGRPEQRPGRGPAESHRPAEPAPAASQLRLRLERVDLGKWASLAPSPSASRASWKPICKSTSPSFPRCRAMCKARSRSISSGSRMRAGSCCGPDGWKRRGSRYSLAARRTAARHHRAPGHDRAGQHRGHRPAVGPARSGRARAAGAPPAPRGPARAGRRRDPRKDGGLVRRDRAVKPDVALEFAGLEAKVTGVAWPSTVRAGSDGGAPAGRRPGRVRRPGGCRSDHRGGAGDRQRR